MRAKKDIKKNKVFKYYVDETALVWKIILSILFIFGYIILSYYENNFNVQLLAHNLSEEELLKIKDILNWFNIGENFMVLFVSILLTSLISSYFGVREKNNIYSELITNDVFASEDFYNALSEENKEKIHNNLNQHRYFNNSKAKANMFSHVKDKLNDSFKDNYYYEECSYDIKCTIYDDYIEKNIVKTIFVLPLEGTQTLKTFPIASSKYMADGSSKFGLDSKKTKVKINDKTVDKKYIKECLGEITDFDKKSGYNEYKRIFCCKAVDLSVKKQQKIEIEYTTVVPIQDLSYVCRLQHACKKYSFNFTLNVKNGKEYSIDAVAFGFVDDASSSPIHTDDNETAIIKFNNWMFPRDGVSISLIEK